MVLARCVNRVSHSSTRYNDQLVTSSQIMCVEYNSASDFVYLPPTPPPPSSSINSHYLNLKSEADRLKTYETWRVPLMDANQLASAGVYSTNWSGVVRCAFCGTVVGRWEEGDGVMKEHQRWGPSCVFVKGLCVGNIPIVSNDLPETSSQQPNSSYDVCGPHMQYR